MAIDLSAQAPERQMVVGGQGAVVRSLSIQSPSQTMRHVLVPDGGLQLADESM
jgi:hypothetical protein